MNYWAIRRKGVLPLSGCFGDSTSSSVRAGRSTSTQASAVLLPRCWHDSSTAMSFCLRGCQRRQIFYKVGVFYGGSRFSFVVWGRVHFSGSGDLMLWRQLSLCGSSLSVFLTVTVGRLSNGCYLMVVPVLLRWWQQTSLRVSGDVAISLVWGWCVTASIEKRWLLGWSLGFYPGEGVGWVFA